LKLLDIEAQAKALAPILRDYVAKAVESVSAAIDGRMLALEKAVSDKIAAIAEPKDGKDGIDGKDAEAIPLETVEIMVSEAVKNAFSAISVPKDGENGKDALEIDILPLIDEEKTYPRGTWARHNGGLWRSHANTQCMRGWECIVDGVCSTEIEQRSERNLLMQITMASGRKTVTPFALPAMIYRNVWKEGHYQKGDVVTFGGCIWHCDQDTDTKPSESAEHWTLAVKKGRDGKSA